jgi:PilZ domain
LNVDGDADVNPMLNAMLKTPGLLGLLGRDVSVRLLDISLSGCLLECSAAVPAGTLATLSVTFDGGRYVDHVRIARCQRVNGAGSTHYIGVEFLSLSAPTLQSLRRFAGEIALAGEGETGAVGELNQSS